MPTVPKVTEDDIESIMRDLERAFFQPPEGEASPSEEQKQAVLNMKQTLFLQEISSFAVFQTVVDENIRRIATLSLRRTATDTGVDIHDTIPGIVSFIGNEPLSEADRQTVENKIFERKGEDSNKGLLTFASQAFLLARDRSLLKKAMLNEIDKQLSIYCRDEGLALEALLQNDAGDASRLSEIKKNLERIKDNDPDLITKLKKSFEDLYSVQGRFVNLERMFNNIVYGEIQNSTSTMQTLLEKEDRTPKETTELAQIARKNKDAIVLMFGGATIEDYLTPLSKARINDLERNALRKFPSLGKVLSFYDECKKECEKLREASQAR